MFKSRKILATTLMLAITVSILAITTSLTVFAVSPDFNLMEKITVTTFDDATNDIQTISPHGKVAYSQSTDFVFEGTNSLKVDATNSPVDWVIAASGSNMLQTNEYTRLSNWMGASYFSFWAKNTSSVSLSATFDFCDGTQNPFEAQRAWRLAAGTEFTLISDAGVVSSGNINGNAGADIPANWEGRVYLPIETLNYGFPIVGGVDGTAPVNMASIVQIRVTYIYQSASDITVYFDDYSIHGEDLKELENSLDFENLQKMQLYGFESVDYEPSSLTFDATFTNTALVNYGYDVDSKAFGEYSIWFQRSSVTEGDVGYGAMNFNTYDLGEAVGVSGKDIGNWSGADCVGFWVNNTNSTPIDPVLQFYENTAAGTAWAPVRPWMTGGTSYARDGGPDLKDAINSRIGTYYLEDQETGAIYVMGGGKLRIPAEFKGFVYIPLNRNNFGAPVWYAPETTEEINLDRIARVSIVFQPSMPTKEASGTGKDFSFMGTEKIFFDNFFVAGVNLEEAIIDENTVLGALNEENTTRVNIKDTSLPEDLNITNVTTIFEFVNDAEILDRVDEICTDLNKLASGTMMVDLLDLDYDSIILNDSVEYMFDKPTNFSEEDNFYFVNLEAGTMTEMEYTILENVVTLTTSDLGVVVYASNVEVVPSPTEEATPTSVPTTTPENETEVPGDRATSLLMLTVLLLSAIISVLTLKKRKLN